ncbi:hypothetical protein Lal_00046263 [Lupinus albus]|uniref:Uncharacterized protein n=1 Tax=Lupinus albus TaxID=3870 RepID=A0A6A4PFT9_LUPAL|nr:hypothetical protein Lalb_Chr14g0372071 [Lupinus albus]KAF1887025.1 hypothetical protein Lal_00046263 [Lupinus albus]
MAVDLQHNRDTSQFQYNDVLLHSQHHNNNNSNKGSYLGALLGSTEVQKKESEEDLIAELSFHMDRLMLQDDNKFDFSANDSHNLELSWDLIGSPQSTVWSTLGSNQGSSEGSTSQEPSPPATPTWKTTQDMMKLQENGNSKYHQIQTLKSNIDLSSHQSLVQEQIRAIELSKVKQDQHVVPLMQKQSAHGESEMKISIKKSEKKEKVVGNGRKSYRPPRPAPLALKHILNQQQNRPGMSAIFIGGSGSTNGGTGVFFPRSGTTHLPSQSTTKKQGKGCATVLIPSRVVQALQLHFNQMSTTSGSKSSAFPPLHDVIVSDMGGIYSLQKQHSEEVPANIMQNETFLPQEWTY